MEGEAVETTRKKKSARAKTTAKMKMMTMMRTTQVMNRAVTAMTSSGTSGLDRKRIAMRMLEQRPRRNANARNVNVKQSGMRNVLPSVRRKSDNARLHSVMPRLAVVAAVAVWPLRPLHLLQITRAGGAARYAEAKVCTTSYTVI